jgi:hypothetical protein
MISDSSCGTWPEQNAVLDWFQKYFPHMQVDHKILHELKESTTAFRLVLQDKLENYERKFKKLRDLYLCENYSGKWEEFEKLLDINQNESGNEQEEELGSTEKDI